MTRSHLVLIGGRSGVGKSSVAAEMHHQLSEQGIHHGWIEGDNLDMAYPMPWREGHKLAEVNLAAMWANYRAIGHSRLIYTNTASVFGHVMASLAEAMGDQPVVHAVLLTADDQVTERRLAEREVGGELRAALDRSRKAARELDSLTPPDVVRLDTSCRSVVELATRIIEFAGWEVGSTRTWVR